MRIITINRRLYVGFGIVIGLMAFVLGYNCLFFAQSRKEARLVKENYVKYLLLGKNMKLNVVQIQQWLTDISATRARDGLDDGFEEARKNAEEFKKGLNEYRKEYAERHYTEGAGKLDKIEKDFDAYYEMGNEMARAYIEGGPEKGNIVMKQFDPFAEKIADTMDAFVDEKMHELDDATHTVVALTQKALFINAVLGGMIFLLGVGIALGIARSIVRPLALFAERLNSCSEHTAGVANKVSSSSQLLAQGNEEQAAAIEETSASLEEITSIIKQNAENANSADDTARASDKLAADGVDSMNRMSEAITLVKGSADATAKIIKTIDEIAFQTNLLALNASIEAARAGEAGKGFAVVAAEVGSLAHRSTEAAKNTATLIGEVQRNAEKSVLVVAETRESLAKIKETAQKVSSLVSAIAFASKEQGKGIEQISLAVHEMDKVMQQSSSSAEELVSAVDELLVESTSLSAVVGGLRELVNGQDKDARRGTSCPERQLAESV